MAAGCLTGGIARLLDLIEEHPAELAYDLRAHCGVSIDDIGKSVSYREALLLLSVITRQPDSWLMAALNDWDYPVSREALVMADVFDLTARVNSGKGKKPKPYPRPFSDKQKARVGRTDKSPAEVKAILAWMNPKESDG